MWYLIYLRYAKKDFPIGEVISIFGIILFVIGITLETVADLQKLIFKLDENNKDKFI